MVGPNVFSWSEPIQMRNLEEEQRVNDTRGLTRLEKCLTNLGSGYRSTAPPRYRFPYRCGFLA